MKKSDFTTVSSVPLPMARLYTLFESRKNTLANANSLLEQSVTTHREIKSLVNELSKRGGGEYLKEIFNHVERFNDLEIERIRIQIEESRSDNGCDKLILLTGI